MKNLLAHYKDDELIKYWMNIPYKYECPFVFRDGSVRYPDFTILDVKTRSIKYFEHFGMMDNEEYSSSFVSKIHDYASNGIYLGINLIATFETLTRPINSIIIENTLRRYLHLN